MVKITAGVCIVIYAVLCQGLEEHVDKFAHEVSVEVSGEVTANCLEVVRASLQVRLENIQETLGSASQIQILDLQYREGVLLMDLSKEIVVYGGGNAAEYQVVSQLLAWAFDQIGAEKLTIKVEGSTMGFPEGTYIVGFTKEEYHAYSEGRAYEKDYICNTESR